MSIHFSCYSITGRQFSFPGLAVYNCVHFKHYPNTLNNFSKKKNKPEHTLARLIIAVILMTYDVF